MTMEMAVIQRAPLVPRLSHMPTGNGNHLPYPHGGAMSPRMLAGLKLASMFPQTARPQARMSSAMTPAMAGPGMTMPGMANPGLQHTARGMPPQNAAFLCPAPSPSSTGGPPPAPPPPQARHPLSPGHHTAATPVPPVPPAVSAMPSPPQPSPPAIPTSPAHLPPTHLPGMVARPQPIAPHHHHHHPQHPQPLHPHPPSSEHHRFLAPVPLISFMFGQHDLDMLLYGYAKSRERMAGHALSGLRCSDLSHGMDKILGGQNKTYSPAKPIQVVAVDPAALDIPEELELQQTTFAGTIHYGIFCKKASIPKGTRFGPFRGKQVNTSEIKTNDDNTHMWEIFEEGKLSHFVDGRGCSGNWMAYVNCARYAQEQNLIAIQVEGEIFYESCKDILQGTELLVWYGDSYLQFMGIPVALKDMGQPLQEESEGGDGFRCDRCGKVFAYKYYRDKHLKYTRCVDHGDRKFPCHLCSRSFEKRDRLRIHILHVHEKHRPHKCMVCAKSFSQSSSLNKHMRVHSGERPYKCVYCSKAFTASSILRTHIRQHSGEKPFKCKHCGKSFASHAAHDSHVRRTHTRDRTIPCHVCGKQLACASDLKFHMTSHNGVRNSSSLSPASSNTDSYGMSSYDEPLDVVGIDTDTSRLI